MKPGNRRALGGTGLLTVAALGGFGMQQANASPHGGSSAAAFSADAGGVTPIPGRFVGDWQAADGSQTVTFLQAQDGDPALATIRTLKGKPCTARVSLRRVDSRTVEGVDAEVVDGSRTTNCPPEESETAWEMEQPGDPLRLTHTGAEDRETLLTHARTRG